MTLQPIAVAPVMGLLATTGAAGFALANATPSILSWTAPNDGAMHRVTVFASLIVGTTETGGLVVAQWQGPGATGAQNTQLFPGGQAAATNSYPPASVTLTVAPNTAVLVKQTSALSVGAATVYAEIWGS